MREAFEIRSKGYEPGFWGTAQAQGILGACLRGLGRYDEAEPLLVESYRTLLEEVPPSQTPATCARSSRFSTMRWENPISPRSTARRAAAERWPHA